MIKEKPYFTYQMIDDSIIIKPADKGGAIVIMDTSDKYESECLKTLSTPFSMKNFLPIRILLIYKPLMKQLITYYLTK